MLIDWFTVLAQAVNFLILVWLLKRFLYQPILNAINAREKHIADELADAEAKKTEARFEREEFKRKNDEIDQQRSALLSNAMNEARAERQRLFDEARKDADSLRAKQQDKLLSDHQRLNEEIAHRLQAEVFSIARKTLTDLAGLSLEECMIDVFVKRIRTLDKEERNRFASSLKSSPIPVLVRSAFELSSAQHTLIDSAVKETVTPETQIRYEIAPGLISGIELIMQGEKFAWSISDYLSSLDKDVNALLKAQHITEANTDSKPL